MASSTVPRLLIADDNPLFRNALKTLLDPNAEIVAEARDGLEAIEQVERFEPELLLLDISMPRLNGIEVLKRLRVSHPDLKIIMLTMFSDLSEQSFKLGANGYFTKDCDPIDLLSAINAVLEGGTFLSAA